MKPIILFRKDRETAEEFEIAQKYFEVTESRVHINSQLVIGRYSVLPFYYELERDLGFDGSKLINSHLEHQYVANFDYYEDLAPYTAKTWFYLTDVPKDSGPWVVKGRTNSRKHQWKEKMFADSWEALVATVVGLNDDYVISQQGTIIRKFLPLELVDEGLTHPMFNEWRFFFWRGNHLAHGWYWTGSRTEGELDSAGIEFAQQVANIVVDKVPFVVVDIARQTDGKWVLIELNDGQMSGLSAVEPHQLYENLAKHLN